MHSYKIRFIDNALSSGALKFGQFTLKSGRTSPHFFNAGEFYTGKALAELGRCYASAIVDSKLEFDVLFGPAYKLHLQQLRPLLCLMITELMCPIASTAKKPNLMAREVHW